MLEDGGDNAVDLVDLRGDHGEAELAKELEVAPVDVAGPKWPLLHRRLPTLLTFY
jgi:hypothetical protein